jgi:hypothetical protein
MVDLGSGVPSSAGFKIGYVIELLAIQDVVL